MITFWIYFKPVHLCAPQEKIKDNKPKPTTNQKAGKLKMYEKKILKKP